MGFGGSIFFFLTQNVTFMVYSLNIFIPKMSHLRHYCDILGLKMLRLYTINVTFWGPAPPSLLLNPPLYIYIYKYKNIYIYIYIHIHTYTILYYGIYFLLYLFFCCN